MNQICHGYTNNIMKASNQPWHIYKTSNKYENFLRGTGDR